MKVIDQTKIYQDYKGQWVVLDSNQTTVLSADKKLSQALNKLENALIKDLSKPVSQLVDILVKYLPMVANGLQFIVDNFDPSGIGKSWKKITAPIKEGASELGQAAAYRVFKGLFPGRFDKNDRDIKQLRMFHPNNPLLKTLDWFMSPSKKSSALGGGSRAQNLHINTTVNAHGLGDGDELAAVIGDKIQEVATNIYLRSPETSNEVMG